MWRPIMAACAIMPLLAACGGGVRDVDNRPERGIDADISASLNHGSTSTEPGKPAGEWYPEGVAPWQIGERHGFQ